MAFPLLPRLFALTVLLVVPFTHATDYLTTYPPFAKCDDNVLNSIRTTNRIFPSKSVYQTLAAQEKWIMVSSSYNFKLSPTKCITLEVKDHCFNVTVSGNEGNETSYKLNYVVKEVNGGLEGHTVPDEPKRSWKLFPILAGDIIQAHYVCNSEFDSKDTPLHGDIFVANSALKNLLVASQVMKNVAGLGKIMESFTKFTFAATEKCLSQ